jgi:hypothetical protein
LLSGGHPKMDAHPKPYPKMMGFAVLCLVKKKAYIILYYYKLALSGTLRS